MATPSSDSSVSNGLYVPTGIANGDVKPVLSATPLADFLMQLEDYTPTVSPSNSRVFTCLRFSVTLLVYTLFSPFRSQTLLQDITLTELVLRRLIRGCEFDHYCVYKN